MRIIRFHIFITVLSLTCFSGSAQGWLTNGLVGYYPFDGNANDRSGNGNNGVMTGGTLVADRFGTPGRALDLNGQGELVTVAHNAGLNLTNDLTISVHCHPTGTEENGWNSEVDLPHGRP